MALHSVDQLAMDEHVIQDASVEQALEFREEQREALSEVRSEYKKADEAAKVEIEKLELPEGGAVRVGRFRITRTVTPARVVSFETAASDRVRIAVVDED